MHLSESSEVDESFAELIRKSHFFASSSPVWTSRAPGRLDFMGGNVDYTGGLVLQRPLEECVHAAFQPSDRPTVRILNPDAGQLGWEPELELPVKELASVAAIQDYCAEGSGTRWGRYALGAFSFLRNKYGAFAEKGGELFLASRLPPNRGLASSAALEIAVLMAICRATGVALSGIALAEAGQWIENIVAGAACGIMDQAAIVLGQQGTLLPILCQPCQPLAALPLPQNVRVWGIDSGVSRSTASPGYETARAAAFMGYRMICDWEAIPLVPNHSPQRPPWTEARWQGYLSNLAVHEFRSRFEHRLPSSLCGRDFLTKYGQHLDPLTVITPEAGYPIRAAVRYACEEHFRIRTAYLLLRSLDGRHDEPALRLIGELLLQSHDAYAECGLGAPGCDELVRLARAHEFFGARMTGGGAGGVIALLGTEEQETEVSKLAAEYAKQSSRSPAIFSGSSDGADRSGAAAVMLVPGVGAAP
jgi:L-arabinokinase